MNLVQVGAVLRFFVTRRSGSTPGASTKLARAFACESHDLDNKDPPRAATVVQTVVKAEVFTPTCGIAAGWRAEPITVGFVELGRIKRFDEGCTRGGTPGRGGQRTAGGVVTLNVDWVSTHNRQPPAGQLGAVDQADRGGIVGGVEQVVGGRQVAGEQVEFVAKA